MDRRTGLDRPANHGFAYRGHGQNADSFGVSGGSVPLYRRHQGPGPGPDSGRVLVRYRPHRVDLRSRRDSPVDSAHGFYHLRTTGTIGSRPGRHVRRRRRESARRVQNERGGRYRHLHRNQVRFVLRNPEHRPIELRRLRHHLRQRFCLRRRRMLRPSRIRLHHGSNLPERRLHRWRVRHVPGSGTTNCNGTCTVAPVPITATAAPAAMPCANGTVCTSGACSACTSNCAVGTACTSNSNCASNSCQAGQCVACPGGQTLCGNACVSTQSDNSHCGSCLNVCPVSQTCSNGNCAPTQNPAGFACNANNQCLSLDCGGGFCCSSSCTDAGGCGTTGSCNSTGACLYAPSGTSCTGGGTCNGTGQCNAPAACTASTANNCVLPSTNSGSSDTGTCAAGFSGSCAYSCISGTFTQVTNTCSPIP